MSSKRIDNSKNLKFYGIPFMVFGFILVVIIFINDANKGREMESINRQLNGIEISGIVTSINQNRGTVTMHYKETGGGITNYSKTYFSGTRNYDLSPYEIHKFIKPKDSIFKASRSMKLEVFREKKQYYFILEKSINH